MRAICRIFQINFASSRYCVCLPSLNFLLAVEYVLIKYFIIGVYVENLSDYVVRTPTEVLQFLSAGKKRLVFAETKMNRTSSR